MIRVLVKAGFACNIKRGRSRGVWRRRRGTKEIRQGRIVLAAGDGRVDLLARLGERRPSMVLFMPSGATKSGLWRTCGVARRSPIFCPNARRRQRRASACGTVTPRRDPIYFQHQHHTFVAISRRETYRRLTPSGMQSETNGVTLERRCIAGTNAEGHHGQSSIEG
jgi:hypothetical protein